MDVGKKRGCPQVRQDVTPYDRGVRDKAAFSLSVGMALGVVLGAAIGLVLDNLALGVGIGVALGAGIGLAATGENSDDNDDNGPKAD